MKKVTIIKKERCFGGGKNVYLSNGYILSIAYLLYGITPVYSVYKDKLDDDHIVEEDIREEYDSLLTRYKLK